MSSSVDCAVVVAVGLSAHQTQLAYSRSRAMLPALGKPLAARVIDRLYSAGIRNYVVVVGEDEGAVAAYLNQHPLSNAQVELAVQSNSESLNDILSDVAEQHTPPFLVTSYNSFAHPHFAERLLKQGAEFSDTLVLSGTEMPISPHSPRFIGYIDGDRLLEIHVHSPERYRHGLLLTDMALCGKGFVDYLSKALPRRSLMELFQDYVTQLQPARVVRAGWALQVYTDEDLYALNRHLLEEEDDISILSEVPGSVQIIPPVRIDPQVSVGPEAAIGPYVYLEAGCSIGHHAVIRNALVLQRANIPPNDVVEDSVVSSRSRIPT